jgi:hypothetical protein
VEQSHEAIIDMDTFKSVQEMLTCARQKYKPGKPVNARYPFTGKIVCSICGKNFQRKTTKGKISWICATYLEHGKSACPAKQIPEETLLSATAEALGAEHFDEASFSKRIYHIEVPAPNILLFVFVDGHRFEYEWRDRSRADSWTDEMKQAAKERSLAIREALTNGSNPETGNEN